MTDETGKVSTDTLQALEDLVSSPGWQFFCQYAQELHGADAIARDLTAAASEITDLYALGSMTSARISIFKAVDQLIAWPKAILDQHRKL